MANLCNTICSGAGTITNLRDVCDGIQLTKAGIGYIGFIKCGTALDMTSAAAIAAAKTANNLILFSAGIGSKGLPTPKKTKIKCGAESITGYTHTIAFKTYDTARTGVCQQVNELITRKELYRMFFVDCEGNWYYDTTALPAENPGFEYGAEGGHNITENDLTENQTFEFTLTVETNQDVAVICPVASSVALTTALIN